MRNLFTSCVSFGRRLVWTIWLCVSILATLPALLCVGEILPTALVAVSFLEVLLCSRGGNLVLELFFCSWVKKAIAVSTDISSVIFLGSSLRAHTMLYASCMVVGYRSKPTDESL